MKVDKKSGKIKIVKIPKIQTFQGVPVLHKYKYLGLWLDYRLQRKHQLKQSREKSTYISKRLYPMLTHCSLEMRTDLWNIFCRPLLEQTFSLFDSEISESNQKGLLRTMRMSFKRMTLLASRVENEIIEKFIDYDFVGRCSDAVAKALRKWEQRTGQISLSDEKADKRESSIGERKKKNLMPKELVEYANLLTAKCTKCPGKIMRVSHLSKDHSIIIPDVREL